MDDGCGVGGVVLVVVWCGLGFGVGCLWGISVVLIVNVVIVVVVN